MKTIWLRRKRSILPFPTKDLRAALFPENRARKSHSKHHAQLRDALSTLQSTHPRPCANSSRSPLLLLPAQPHAHHLRNARLLHRHAVDHVRRLHHAFGVRHDQELRVARSAMCSRSAKPAHVGLVQSAHPLRRARRKGSAGTGRCPPAAPAPSAPFRRPKAAAHSAASCPAAKPQSPARSRPGSLRR